MQENSSLESGGGGHAREALQWQQVSGSSRSLLWAGVTAADQSPTLPAHVAVEEKSLKKHLKRMNQELESSAAHEDAIGVAHQISTIAPSLER